VLRVTLGEHWALKTLYLYLSRQVVLSLLITVSVFTFVLLLGNVLREILDLLVAGRVSAGSVVRAVGLLVPFIMPFVLPFGMLTAVILVFGRFSADQELTAVRASGISLLSLTPPILLLSLALSGLSAWFNLQVAPRCREAYKGIVFQLGARTVSNLITEDRFIDEIPGMVLYLRKRNRDHIEDVRIYNLAKDQITSKLSAKSGIIHYDEAERKIWFELFDVVVDVLEQRTPAEEESFIGPPPPEKPSEWRIVQLGRVETPDPPVDLSDLLKADRKPKLSEMSFARLRKERAEYEAKGVEAMPIRVQLHRQVAFSFACFAFTLVGIPLAIQAHRRETSIGVALALGLVLIYYAFFITADALAARENLHPHLLVWIPNILFQGVGVLLLKRVNHR
jgi:lipopolysaccharide export system permease protein